MKNKLESLKKVRIGVIGDLMLDCYIEGKVSRVSPEAPIPVVDIQHTRYVPGGAANVCKNIAEFGNDFELIGVIGNDLQATQLLELLATPKKCFECVGVDEGRPTSIKTRILGNGQQIVRIDHESIIPITGEIESKIIENIKNLSSKVDALLIADYSKGVLTEKVVKTIIDLGQNGVDIIVDPHPKNSCIWKGVHTLKPNLQELQNISGLEITLNNNENPLENDSLNKAVDWLMSEWEIKNLMVTLSEHGMILIKNDGSRHWEPTRALEVFDVSGAGDTAIAYYTLAVASGWNTVDSVKLANCASGIVVKKLGTASLDFDELNNIWKKQYG